MYVYQITSLLELVKMRTLTMFSVILRCSNGSILPIDANMVWREKPQEMNRSVNAGLVYK